MSETAPKTKSKFGNLPGPGPGRGKKKPRPNLGFDPGADLLFVYRNSSDKDVTPGQKAARKLLESNYQQFMTLYFKAVGMPDAPEEKVAAAATAAIGEKEERVEELAERLLREWEQSQGLSSPQGG